MGALPQPPGDDAEDSYEDDLMGQHSYGETQRGGAPAHKGPYGTTVEQIAQGTAEES